MSSSFIRRIFIKISEETLYSSTKRKVIFAFREDCPYYRVKKAILRYLLTLNDCLVIAISGGFIIYNSYPLHPVLTYDRPRRTNVTPPANNLSSQMRPPIRPVLLSTRGLNPSELAELFRIRPTEREILEVNDCAICLALMIFADDNCVKLICNHIFHRRCIRDWLHSRPTCPLCRMNMFNSPRLHNRM